MYPVIKTTVWGSSVLLGETSEWVRRANKSERLFIFYAFYCESEPLLSSLSRVIHSGEVRTSRLSFNLRLFLARRAPAARCKKYRK